MIYLFVLASEQGVLRPEKTMESPLPSSPSLSARAHALPCALAEALLRRAGEERSVQPLSVWKQYTSLARGPQGWTPWLRLPGKRGRAQEPLCRPVNACLTRASRGSACWRPPVRPQSAPGQSPPALRGAGLKANPHRQPAGRGGRRGLARRRDQKRLQRLFGAVPKVFVFPSFLLLDCRGWFKARASYLPEWNSFTNCKAKGTIRLRSPTFCTRQASSTLSH